MKTEHKLGNAALAFAFTALCAFAAEGCATSSSWADLLEEAEPEFTVGECGPQLNWHKTLVVYDKADVEATIVVKPHCPKPNNEAGKPEPAETEPADPPS